MDWYRLPLIEYARGACECVLTLGEYSHVILYSKKTPAYGGVYLGFTGIPYDVTDIESFTKDDIKRVEPGASYGARYRQGTPTGACTYLLTVDLSKDVELQIADIETVYEKRVGRKYNQNEGYGW